MSICGCVEAADCVCIETVEYYLPLIENNDDCEMNHLGSYYEEILNILHQKSKFMPIGTKK
jgi:hypothetical protein